MESALARMIDGPLPDDPVPPVAGAGAFVSFSGIVRPTENERPIAGIRYETYDPMAANELERLAREAVERFDILAVTAEHSRGFVPNGACSFRLHVAAAHRKPALAAMDWYIDEMKRVVPIWKHVLYRDATESEHP